MSTLGLLLILLPFWQQLSQELAGKTATYQGRPATYWLHRLQHPSSEARGVAFHALERLGPDARCAVPTLLRLVHDKNNEELYWAVAALCCTYADQQQLLVVMRELLKDPKEERRIAVIKGLGQNQATALVRLLVPDLLRLLPEAAEDEADAIRWIVWRVKFDLEKDAPLLRSLLEHKETKIRFVGIWMLHHQRCDAQFTPLLARLINDVDEGVRDVALELLCRYAGEGMADPRYLLFGLLEDCDCEARSVMQALVLLGPAAKPILPALTAALPRNRGWAKLNLARAILMLEDNAEALNALEDFCHDNDEYCRKAAQSFLGRIAKEHKGARAKLRDIVLGGKSLPEGFTADVFEELGTEALPILTAAFDSKDRAVRRLALQGLGNLPVKEETATKLLMRECREGTDAALRFEAALILARTRGLPEAVAYLGEAMTNADLDQELRQDALAQLARWQQEVPAAAHHLRRCVQAPEAWLRAAAVAYLKVDVKKLATVADLRKALVDPAAEVRAEAARKLGRIGKDARQAVTDLQRLLQDPAPRVQGSALEALSKLDPDFKAEHVRPFLKHPCKHVRSAAAQACARCPGTVKEILPDLLALARDRYWLARLMVMNTLGELRLDDERIFACLVAALVDPHSGDNGLDDDLDIDASIGLKMVADEAFKSLRRYDHLPPAVLAKLWPHLWSGHGENRLWAASVLFKVQKSPLALAVLRNGLKDRDHGYRTMAESQLRFHHVHAYVALPGLLHRMGKP